MKIAHYKETPLKNTSEENLEFLCLIPNPECRGAVTAPLLLRQKK